MSERGAGRAARVSAPLIAVPANRPMPVTWVRLVGHVSLALACAVADVRLFTLLMPAAFARSASVLEGVVHREPLWRVYQSRLLGPWLVHEGAALAGVDASVAYAWFALATLFVAGLVVLLATDHARDVRRSPYVAMFLFHLGIVLLLPCLWIYAWDLVSLVVFATFNALVLARARRRWFVVLYAWALLNHELAFFIAGWLALDPIVRALAARRRGGHARIDWSAAAVGAVLLGAGIALVEFLRSKLMIREMQPGLELPPAVVYGRSFHFTLFFNLRSLVGSADSLMAGGFAVVVPVFLLLVLIVAVGLWLTDAERSGALALVTIGMVVALCCFGLLLETRVLLPLVQFVAFHGARWLAPLAGTARPAAA